MRRQFWLEEKSGGNLDVPPVFGELGAENNFPLLPRPGTQRGTEPRAVGLGWAVGHPLVVTNSQPPQPDSRGSLGAGTRFSKTPMAR